MTNKMRLYIYENGVSNPCSILENKSARALYYAAMSLIRRCYSEGVKPPFMYSDYHRINLLIISKEAEMEAKKIYGGLYQC